jgi:vesicle-fusing ATPase
MDGVPPPDGLGPFELQIVNCPSQDLAKTNAVFVAPDDPAATALHLTLGDFIFAVRSDAAVPLGCLGLNAAQRRIIKVSSGDRTLATAFFPPTLGFLAGVVNTEVDYVSKKAVRGPDVELDAPALTAHLLSRFAGQVWTVKQEIAFEFQGTNYQLNVNSVVGAAEGGEEALAVHQGLLAADSAFVFETRHGSGIKIAGQRAVVATQLFKHKEFNFESLGIGGLDAQFEQIFRRAFASRIFPPAMVERLGIHHVKGVLLYGPPGTGKTLIARQIGKMLNGREPKIVNGPEVLSKYVGASEENIRNLFKEAEVEYQRSGDASDLHVIIFDEIDAICKSRGSVQSGAGVHDTVVNQLLTKIDGVDALNNILLIGMTNRKDMLDEALLRPGRLEVQVEIGLPDERGRLQILQIHTNKMSQNSFLARDVDLYDLAQRTKNFSGAEIEGLVKSATSFALNRQVDVNDLSKPIDEENIKVTMQDFLAAVEEVVPAFGATIDTLDSYRLHGVVDYGPRHQHLLSSCRTLVRQVESSEATPLVTALLEGPQGTGKTALAATVAIESGFPFVKVVSAENMVGFSEPAKCQQIAKIFDDAYKSPLSMIVLDDIERLLEYVAIGPRFSNAILQTLLVLLKKAPPPGRRLFILGTTSLGMVMEEMDVAQTFNVTMHVPTLNKTEMKTVLGQLGAFAGQDVSFWDVGAGLYGSCGVFMLIYAHVCSPFFVCAAGGGGAGAERRNADEEAAAAAGPGAAGAGGGGDCGAHRTVDQGDPGSGVIMRCCRESGCKADLRNGAGV